MTPQFILATDLQPFEPAWVAALAQTQAIATACAPILGFDPVVRLASISDLDESLSQDATEIFVLPVALDFNLFQRETIGRVLAEARRRLPHASIHHDDVDPGHPLLVDCFAHQAALANASQKTGLILAAGGHGDAGSRGHSYRLMRLVWEQLGMCAGEVGFLRNSQPFLLHVLEKCANTPLPWIVVPQFHWRTEHVEYAETILQNFQKSHPEAAEWRIAEPPGNHPAMTAWLAQRITRLWQDKRTRDAVRSRSAKGGVAKAESWTVGGGTIASISSSQSMAHLVARILPEKAPERILVKVTWHGYATGTYTDPAALDLLLGALPAKALVLEGHTSSRNIEDAPFDWETQAQENRAWIRQHEAEYLRRTGLAEVLARHGAQYINVTEANWDRACTDVSGPLRERGVTLHHPELAQFVPKVLLQYLGCPMISFAKFKGPTRLGISNLFGLLPAPLRTAWHGPNITYFARVCCDVAKLYGALFDLCGLNEALYSAVSWNRRGLYRSRWGNYDLITDAGYVTASRNIATADILASRLQGQDVSRSAFFDVVRAELEWDEGAASEPLPASVQSLLV